MVHAAVRYFDPEARRPGLPPYVAALVDRVETDHIRVHLVNTDVLDARQILLQAGACGEHAFVDAAVEGPTDGGGAPQPVDSKLLRVRLGPSAQGRIRIGIRRFAHRPSYEFPTFPTQEA